MMQLVILAGGRGSRLGALTARRPKALLSVAGHPFLEWVMRYVETQSVSGVHFCLGIQADQIIRFLRTRESRLPVTYSVETAPLGTAGCLLAAEPWLDPHFMVMYGDTFTPLDMGAVQDTYRRGGTAALMTVLENHDHLVRSNVRVSDGLVRKYDKNAPAGSFTCVDYGVLVMAKSVLERIAGREPIDLASVLSELISRSEVAEHRVTERFYEIGTVSSYNEFKQLVESGSLVFTGEHPALG
jgi:NDP-sugar pyrophosphorylase family protein